MANFGERKKPGSARVFTCVTDNKCRSMLPELCCLQQRGKVATMHETTKRNFITSSNNPPNKST
jgi:hypothetical protein